MTDSPASAEAADVLSGQHASGRSLAGSGGATALRTVAEQFDDDALRNRTHERKVKVPTPMTPINEEVPQAELDRYGIERVPADIFLWGGYRYSNARDALAAAKRNVK